MPAILKAEFGIGQGWPACRRRLYWQLAAIRRRDRRGLGWADRWMRRTSRAPHLRQPHRNVAHRAGDGGVGYAPSTGLLWVAVAFLILFGLGWAFRLNNMRSGQIARPELRATGYGIMNLVRISCGGFADWGFGILVDRQVPLFGIFSVFASAASCRSS